jgi:protein SCO1/2
MTGRKDESLVIQDIDARVPPQARVLGGRITRRTAIVAIALIAMVVGALFAYTTLRPGAKPLRFESIDVTGVPWGRDFALTDHHGRARTLKDFRGKVVTLFFGFTHCPDVCPTTLATLGEAIKRLGAEADQVQGLFLTVDPKRDTPQILAQYAPAFYPSFLGLYADEATTERTAKEFKVFFDAEPPDEHGAYSVVHSGQTYAFDRRGRLRLIIRSQATPESVAHDLRILLQESDG